MITTFRHVGLWELFQTSTTYDIDDDLCSSVLIRLEALHHAERPEDLDLPGFRLRVVLDARPARYAMLVKDWRLTFGFHRGAAIDVDWERAA